MPATGPVIVTAVVVLPLHTVWLAIAFTDGVGFTVMVNTLGVPVQVTPPSVSDGVIVIVATIGALVVLVAVKPGISPTPMPARPIVGWLFVQRKIVPTDGPKSGNGAIGVPLHTTWLVVTVLSTGVGFTVIVNVVDAPVQVTPPPV